MSSAKRAIRNCRLDGSVNALSDLQIVQQLFVSEKLIQPMIVFQRKIKKNGLYDYISYPQLHQSNQESYYYALCLQQNNDNITHAPIHTLIVDDKDDEYEQFLRNKAQQHPEIFNILMISFDYLKKICDNKALRKKNKKYLQKGVQKGKLLAHTHVFEQILVDIGERISSNLRYRKHQTAEQRNKEHGQHRTLSIGLDNRTWNLVGFDILKTACYDMQREGNYIHFSNIKDEIKVFRKQLKKKRTQGKYIANNVKFSVNIVEYNITAWYDIVNIDKKGLPHPERL